jgi:glucosylceramidase
VYASTVYEVSALNYVDLSGSVSSASPMITQGLMDHLTNTASTAVVVDLDSVIHTNLSGLGGAFNEQGGEAFMSLPEADRTAVAEALFNSDTGAGLTLCRTAIGSSDFGLSAYSYSETSNDYAMADFSVERDTTSVIPFILAAQDQNPEFRLFASPWSPPGWMKLSGKMDGGNADTANNVLKSDPAIYQAYALYFSKYIQAYAAQGVVIDRLTVQNETDMNPKYPGCDMMPTQMVDLVSGYIRPQFETDGLTTEIWAGTFRSNRSDAQNFMALTGSTNVVGVGLQYNTAAVMATLQSLYPGLKMMHTEGKCWNGSNSAAQAQSRFAEIALWLNSGCENYCYWNMVLNETSTSAWGWKQNSLMKIDRSTGAVTYNADFSPIYLLSRFIRPGDQLLSVTPPSGVTAIAVRNSERVVVFLQNDATAASAQAIEISGQTYAVDLPAQSLCAFVFVPETEYSPVTPVGHWSLNEDSGTVAADESGNGWDGAVSNATWVAGLEGGALNFNGSNSTVSLPASAFVSVSNEVTVAMWVYGAESQPRDDTLFYAQDASGNRVLNINLPGLDSTVYWDAGNSGGSLVDSLSTNAATGDFKGAWNHWAFTKNATNGEMKIYLNGALWHSATGQTRTMTGITAVTLGANTGGASVYDGKVDDVWICDTALSEAQIATVYSHAIRPEADAKSVTVDEDASVGILLTGTDPQEGDLVYTLKSSPSHGTLSGTAPALTYRPETNYYGDDSFIYQVSNALMSSQSASVDITVMPVEDPPYFSTRSIELVADAEFAFSNSLAGYVTDVDDGCLTFSALSGPAWLTVSTNGALSGTPDGAGSWQVQVQDEGGLTDTATLQITLCTNITGYWAFDAGSGTVAQDSSGFSYHGTVTNGTWVEGLSGRAVLFDGSSSRVILPAAAFSSISNEVTIALWVYGADSQPRNDTSLYAQNASGNRVLNINLPWSDSKVYWDAGNLTTAYDRISKIASTANFMGRWNHWVFTKNATTGEMKVYLNGALWHSGTGKTRTMAGITSVALGANTTGDSGYAGTLDELRLYKTELSADAVQALYTESVQRSFNGWAADAGLSGTNALLTADSDGDGLKNLLEYAFGGNPLDQDDASLLPGFCVSSESFDYIYRRRRDAASRGLSYQLAATTNLVSGTWVTNGFAESVGVVDDEFEIVTNRFDTTGQTNGFVRLNVENQK